VEISPKLVAEAQKNIDVAGLSDQASVIKAPSGNGPERRDVVTIYLATDLNGNFVRGWNVF